MQSLSSLEREIFRSFFLLTDTNSMYICMHDDEIKLLGNTITSPKNETSSVSPRLLTSF
jgi:hypothetical protein